MFHLTPLLTALATPPAPSAAATEMEAPPPPRILETNFSAGAGFAGGSAVGGMIFSALITHDIGMLELGLTGDMILLTSQLYGAGALAGVRIGDDVSFRVLAAAGVHHYEDSFRDLGSGDPGISGTLPFVGARWLFGYRFKVSSTRRRPWLGVLGLLDHDLLRERRRVTYLQSDPFGGSFEHTRTHELGQLTLAVQVLVGWELDLTPY